MASDGDSLDSLNGPFSPGKQLTRPANLNALRNLDLIPEPNATVPGEVACERTGG